VRPAPAINTQLHPAGPLKKSFRPTLEIVPLRFLMRHRPEMLGDSARQLQLMQKTLAETNIKIQHVFSDIDGTSAQATITAILQGERDPAKLADLRDGRCRSSVSAITGALKGDYREEHLFVLGQSQSAWRKVASRLAKPLRMGVFGLQKSNAKLGDYVRKMKARLGKAEGIVAGAHKLARIIYGMIKNQKPYNGAEAFKTTPQTAARRRRNLERQAAALGLQLVAAV
jgi:hypothetical protein